MSTKSLEDQYEEHLNNIRRSPLGRMILEMRVDQIAEVIVAMEQKTGFGPALLHHYSNPNTRDWSDNQCSLWEQLNTMVYTENYLKT
jgi:hypothetical protein